MFHLLPNLCYFSFRFVEKTLKETREFLLQDKENAKTEEKIIKLIQERTKHKESNAKKHKSATGVKFNEDEISRIKEEMSLLEGNGTGLNSKQMTRTNLKSTNAAGQVDDEDMPATTKTTKTTKKSQSKVKKLRSYFEGFWLQFSEAVRHHPN